MKNRRNIDNQNIESELIPGTSTTLLKEIGLIKNDGKLHADSLRKVKQINHLLNFAMPLMEKLIIEDDSSGFIDCGAGNSYLGFIFYEILLRNKWPLSHHISIESRDDLFVRSLGRAQKLNFNRMRFYKNTISDFLSNDTLLSDLKSKNVRGVFALHACNTATDESILLGLKLGVKAFMLIPCCQSEFSTILHSISKKKSGSLQGISSLFENPIHRREFGSHLTNVVRVLLLKSFGYKVTVTEFTGLEHSLKNELILAEKHQDAIDKSSVIKLKKLLGDLGFFDAEIELPMILRELLPLLGD